MLEKHNRIVRITNEKWALQISQPTSLFCNKTVWELITFSSSPADKSATETSWHSEILYKLISLMFGSSFTNLSLRAIVTTSPQRKMVLMNVKYDGISTSEVSSNASAKQTSFAVNLKLYYNNNQT